MYIMSCTGVCGTVCVFIMGSQFHKRLPHHLEHGIGNMEHLE